MARIASGLVAGEKEYNKAVELRNASLAQEVKLAEETARETKDGPLAREKHEPREQPSASSRGRMSSMALRATEEKAEMAAAQKRRNMEEVRGEGVARGEGCRGEGGLCVVAGQAAQHAESV